MIEPVKKDPFSSDRDARFAAAQDAWRRGDGEGARAAFAQLARDFPADDEVSFALAVVYLHLDDHERAAPLFHTYSQRHPDNAAAREYLARCTRRAGEAQAPPAPRSALGGNVVIGRASSVQFRYELNQNAPLQAYAPNIDKRNVSVLTFRLTPLNGGRSVAVELRGPMIHGTPPREGDRVAVPQRSRRGGLCPKRIENLETGEIIEAVGPSRIAIAFNVVALGSLLLFLTAVIAALAFGASRFIPLANDAFDTIDEAVKAQPAPNAQPSAPTFDPEEFFEHFDRMSTDANK